MRISLRGQTDGFVLLRALLLTVALLLVLSVMLISFAAVMKQSGGIERQAERIISARNEATYRELNARK
jgi:hypothetical protein